MFNAIILLLYANLGATYQIPLFVQFVFLISFLPMNKYFKNSLLGLESAGDEVREKGGAGLSQATAAMASGAIMSKFDGHSGKMKQAAQKQGLDANKSSHNIKPNTTNKEALKGSLGLSRASDEAGRFAGKGAAVVAGMGLSLGSAATGGNPLIGNKAAFAGIKSMANQIEGWSADDDEVVTMQGSELKEEGFKGFASDNETLLLD
jgi:hypothetical protein